MTGSPEHDVLIIGGGLSGIYALYRAQRDGLRAKVLEAGSGVGGTWFWNRRKELLDEWSWSEHFATQPETLRYIEYIVDRFDLKKDIQFNTRVKSAHYQSDASWLLTDESGQQYTSRFFIPAIGILNSPTYPAIPGIPSFRGESYHTSRWPTDLVDLSNKRVAVIGTGATGIQVIQTIYKTVQSLVVFQRTANWTAPMNNAAIDPAGMAEIRRSYPEIFAKCDRSPTCFMHEPIMRGTADVPAPEREEIWENLFRQRGFAKWSGAFVDLMTDREANRLYSDFVAKKIRARVHDPETAEKLVPKDHGFGLRRVPLEMEYYDAFNQANVELVDLKSDSIETVHEAGIRTSKKDFEFDVIIFATGFDAITGSFDAMDIQGVDEIKLRDRWDEKISTYLGIAVRGFPNILMSLGPHQALGNIPRTIEHNVGWIMDFVKWAHDKGVKRIEATEEGERSWTEHVDELYGKTLLSDVNSWMTGINTNLKHRQTRRAMIYMGGAVEYRQRAEEVKQKGYEGFELAANST
ncbi:Polyamine oxidase [Elsinoe australis]|uniref:Polyamine oxidase n=1 Tax=Elsinoe australis TaxID=40998 RepID=A0A2P7ZZZ9_9PEZI|nr:Polyamine oxidase [Elsinoe australis]